MSATILSAVLTVSQICLVAALVLAVAGGLLAALVARIGKA